MKSACAGVSPDHENGCLQETAEETTDTRIKHVVLVHGASHGAWCWYKVVTILLRRGFTVAAIDLTSMGKNRERAADSVSSIAEFAKPLLDYLENVTDKVLLVGHSLGGVTVSYAMEQYPNNIGKAVFLTAHMPLNNQSFITNIPPNVPNLVPRDGQKLKYANGRSAPPTSAEFNPKYIPDLLYSESPEEDIQLALSLLSPQPFAVASEVLRLTPERYGRVPRFYIMTGKDRLEPPSVQQMFIDVNPPHQVLTIDSDHSPFFSRPSELTTLLEQISNMTLKSSS